MPQFGMARLRMLNNRARSVSMYAQSVSMVPRTAFHMGCGCTLQAEVRALKGTDTESLLWWRKFWLDQPGVTAVNNVAAIDYVLAQRRAPSKGR